MKKIFAFAATALLSVSMYAASITCAEAKAKIDASDKSEYTVEGFVTEIIEMNPVYTNLTVWMADAVDGGQVFEGYRMSIKDVAAADIPVVGDKIAVTATLKKYTSSGKDPIYETDKFKSLAIVTKGTGTRYTDADIAITTATVAEATAVAEALTPGEGETAVTKNYYEVTGYVIAVTTPYDKDKKNMTFTMADEKTAATGTLIAYRAGVQAKVGDKVKVSGYLSKYVKGETKKLEIQNGAAEVVEAAPVDVKDCASAATAALSVAKNGDFYDNGKEFTIAGYVTDIAAKWKDGVMSFWMADTQTGGKVLEAFKCAIKDEKDAPKVGDKVEVTGKLTKYNTTPEFAEGCTCKITEAAPEPKNLGEKTIAEFLSLKNTTDTCILKGIVANIVMDKDDKTKYNKYGNFDLVGIDGDAGQVYVYGLLTADGKAGQFLTMGIDANDTVTLKAVYSVHEEKAEAKNSVFVSVKKAAGGAGGGTALVFDDGQVLTEYFEEDGSIELSLFNFANWTEQGAPVGDGDWLTIAFYPESMEQMSGTFTVEDGTLETEYSYLLRIVGKDTTQIYFDDGTASIKINSINEEEWMANISVVASLLGEDSNTYTVNATLDVFYEVPEQEGIEAIATEQNENKVIMHEGHIYIIHNGKAYGITGARVK